MTDGYGIYRTDQYSMFSVCQHSDAEGSMMGTGEIVFCVAVAAVVDVVVIVVSTDLHTRMYRADK